MPGYLGRDKDPRGSAAHDQDLFHRGSLLISIFLLDK
jgi:hypothetical protein